MLYKEELEGLIEKLWEMRENGESMKEVEGVRKELLEGVELYGKELPPPYYKILTEMEEVEDKEDWLMCYGRVKCNSCGEELKYCDGDMVYVGSMEDPPEYGDPYLYCINPLCVLYPEELRCGDKEEEEVECYKCGRGIWEYDKEEKFHYCYLCEKELYNG